jgi:dTDP-4-amino-4,6-dideoxygalactose transaminase
VLAPAYHHGSEIESLARTGADIVFYGCDESLEPDPAELDGLITPSVRVLYLIHYLGFMQDVRRWRAWCDERGLLLFEDVAQAWLSTRDGHHAGSLGDLSIFCFYKTLGLGQPGGLLCSSPPPGPHGAPVSVIRAMARSEMNWLCQRFDVVRLAGLRRPREEIPDRDTEFALGDPDRRPSRIAVRLPWRSEETAIRERRRANYAALLRELAEHVPPPFRVLDGGASPLQFPILARDRRGLVERLASNGVEAGEAWPMRHPLVEPERFPSTEALRHSVVGLPVHQQLREGDLEHILAAARRAL